MTFADDLPPLYLTHRELLVMLPADHPLDFLMDRSISSDGKLVCPVPLSENYDALLAIQIECDMAGGEGGWNAMPFMGSTLDWPLAVLDLLRHIRSVNGQVQMKAMEDMEKKSDGNVD